MSCLTKHDMKNGLIRLRRDFHKYPESGWVEYRTSAIIADLLESYGYDVYVGEDVCESSSRMGVPEKKTLKEHEARALSQGANQKYITQMQGGHTGVVGVLKSEKPGPIIALRFDIDALDIEESNDENHIPKILNFQSNNTGMMHACGHDGHIAIGLGVAKQLYENKQLIRGEIRLLFQPAEEGCRGAKSMVDKGWLNNVNYFYSGHIAFQSFKLGEIVTGVGGFFATTKIDAKFRGKKAHAGDKPERGRNALLAASACSLHLHSISRHSEGKTRINVGTLHAGGNRNTIPDFGLLSLETRGETANLNNYMTDQAIKIIKSTAEMYDVKCQWEIVGKADVANSSSSLKSFIKQELKSVDIVTSVTDYTDLNASEDVVYMINKVQEQGGEASYLLFGSPIPAGHHQPDFDFDEEVLEIGVEVLSHIIYSTLKKDNSFK